MKLTLLVSFVALLILSVNAHPVLPQGDLERRIDDPRTS
jgi:hypothetical protein